MRCAFCGGDAKPKPCPGDGGHHRHGMVHVPSGDVVPACTLCLYDVWEMWNPTLVMNPDVDALATFEDWVRAHR